MFSLPFINVLWFHFSYYLYQGVRDKMGTRNKAGEEWAKRIVGKELKRTVVINDDNSAPGMYVLRIGPVDTPEVAIECVGAVDPIYTETWNIGPAKGPLKLLIKGDWNLTIAPTASLKALKQRIEPLIQELENQGIQNLHVDYWLKRDDATLFEELESLGITGASCYRTPGTGEVHLGLPGIGGIVDDQGDALPGWVGEFLRDPARQDVLSKLQRSGAPELHAFVLVSFASVTWPVESYLTGELNHLPSRAPDLPPPVTGVWVVSTMAQRGVYWDGDTWQLFEARGEGITK